MAKREACAGRSQEPSAHSEKSHVHEDEHDLHVLVGVQARIASQAENISKEARREERREEWREE